ncbi:MAG: LytR/AlgR family response regulator transcription factor [Bacteroidales bacterium]
MQRNPLIESNKNKLTWTAATIIVAAVIWSLLIIYGNIEKVHALAASIVYTTLLSLSGYLYWYITEYIRAIQAQTVIALANQILILSITYAVATISGMEHPAHFTRNIPLFATTGILSWIVLVQWYSKIPHFEQNEQDKGLSENGREENHKETNSESTIEVLDKISVKEGSHIHIINLNDLNYVQAYGDYVMLFTENGKHIKEQTMRYFETHLPPIFVRIHRSSIVNSEKIARAELFGKESYNIYLKNGTCLKASATGYKLLKERLLL